MEKSFKKLELSLERMSENKATPIPKASLDIPKDYGALDDKIASPFFPQEVLQSGN